MAENKPTKEEISKVMSALAKRGHKKKPRSKKYFSEISKKRWEKRDVDNE